MKHNNYDHISLEEMETIQKKFENKVLPSEVFENGELRSEFVENFLEDYYKDYHKIFENSGLSQRTKALIALAVASAIYRPYCIDLYSEDVLENGWSEDQVKEAMEIAAAVKSGFTSVHAVKKMNEKVVTTKGK